jgi:prolyl-tRNA editing enzyme YbaK/EbsC (Cys-tRNA(Pro) deacylase)
MFVACVVLATARLDVNRAVRQRMGARKVSFANAEETAEMTGMMIGGVTPPGLPPELPLWVDAGVMEREWVIIGGGSRSMKVKLAPDGLVRLGGEVVEGLATG